MHEQIARVLYYLGVHLLYASLVWLSAWLLTAIPRGSATAKYWIWVATSLNFMLPAGALIDRLLARHLTWASPLHFIGGVGARIAENASLTLLLAGLWLVGAILMSFRLGMRVRGAGESGRSDQPPAFFTRGVPVRFASSSHPPSVNGVLRPRISLPGGIDRLLTEPELDAVLIHELTHARRRDNLIRLVHEIGLCTLWFHPLVWFTGSRLSLYRELSCDESVVQNARGRDLVSALAKLANAEQPVLLQALASSFMSVRLARLASPAAARTGAAASTLMAAIYGVILAAGVLQTVAHTACCFLTKH